MSLVSNDNSRYECCSELGNIKYRVVIKFLQFKGEHRDSAPAFSAVDVKVADDKRSKWPKTVTTTDDYRRRSPEGTGETKVEMVATAIGLSGTM